MKAIFFKLCFILAALFFAQYLGAQQIDDFEDLIKRQVLPSPDAASLGKYGQIPVNLNSGTPQIDVPLYAMKGNELGVDVSVSYHGSGIKVSEVASVVGLGWSLNAGGVITRVVRGWPDESGRGYFSTFTYFKSDIENSPEAWSGNGFPNSKIIWKLRFTQGYQDKEPDVFYFNFDGYSGRIFLNENKEAICFPYQGLKITRENQGDSWTITTPEGTVYYFGKREYTTFKFGGSFISSWYLSMITSPKSTEVIEFEYQDNNISWEEDLGTLPKSRSFNKRINSGDNTLPFCHTENLQEEIETVTTSHVKKITFASQKLSIVFNYANDRQDINSSQSVKRLTGINILHGTSLLKSYTFGNNHYFTGSDSPSPAYLNKRLRLNSITNNTDNTSYQFEYYDQYRMPSYISADTDHWGYYNYAHNSSLIPNTVPDDMSLTYHFSNSDLTADKETNPQSVMACALKKIKYPTGGSSSFTWEPNAISHDSISELQNKVWDISYSRSGYVPSSLELGFMNYMKSLYVDDPHILNANIVMSSCSKYEAGLITPHIYGLDPGNMPQGYYRVYLYKFQDDILPEGPHPIVPFPFDILNHPDCRQLGDNNTLQIGRGTYYLIILATNNPNVSNMSATVSFKESETIRYVDRSVGGTRIKEIVHGDGLTPENRVTRQYSYKRDFLVPLKAGEPVGYQRSSGRLFSELTYHYEAECSRKLVATSYPVNSQGEPFYKEGSHIGYGEVTETVSDNNGFKITKFWNEEDVAMRHLVLSEQWYDNNRTVTKELFHDYVSYISFQNPVKRLNINLVHSYIIPANPYDVYRLLFSTFSPASTSGTWFGRSKTIERTYAAGGPQFVRDSVLYYYDSAPSGKHPYLTRKRSFNSDNLEVLETYKYAKDFTPSGNFIQQMVNRHIMNEPVEYVRKVNSAIVAAYYRKYISSNSREIYECDFSKYPAVSSGIDGSGNLTSNTYYRKSHNLNLDAAGNLQSIVKDDAIPTSFIHGYNNTLPVVAIENIPYNQISSSIINSIKNRAFSESGQTSAITADINFVKSTLGSLYNDKNYLVTIYTYKPLVGVTSVTGPGGATIFYEYDSSGRLQYTRDHNGKVIEQYNYHYKP